MQRFSPVTIPVIAVSVAMSACASADSHAPCSDLDVQRTALINAGAAIVESSIGDPNTRAVVHDDRYVLVVPQRARRIVGMDSLVAMYAFDETNALTITWPVPDVPPMQMSLQNPRRLSTSDDGRIIACEADGLSGQAGQYSAAEIVTFRVQHLDDGRLNVFGQVGELTFRSPGDVVEPAGGEVADPSREARTRASVDEGSPSSAPGRDPAPPPTPARERSPLTPSAAEGQRLFTGPAGCHACHGREADGTALGPDLTDDSWLNVSDPSVENLVRVIRRGVAQPVRYPGPMPPTGGARLSDEQIHSLTAYILHLNGL